MQKKLVILFLVVMAVLLFLVLYLTYINASSGDKYRKQVLSQAQQSYESETLAAKRGDIYDRDGNILATSNKVYNVILDCKALNESDDGTDATVQALVEVLGLDEEEIREYLTDEDTRESQYQILMKNLSMDLKKTFEEYADPGEDSGLTEEELAEREKITGVWFEEDYLRVYPFGSTACDTIGFTFSRDTADWGLEGYYNSTLTGVDGRQYGYVNEDSDVEQTIVEATDGNNIVTTLDLGIQEIVEKYVDAFMEGMGAENVGVIVMDPNTGEILAMDGGDRYDLNSPRDMTSVYSDDEIASMNDAETVEALNDMWSNFCTTETYEPGSVVKPIVMAAALDTGVITTSDTFLCDGGESFDSDTFIQCAVYPDSHGTETLAEIIANSCNDGMMQIASKMGVSGMLEAQSLFNFGTRTGIDLPNEGTGILFTEETMGTTELAASGFGQGFTLTMIQEISTMCSVINGGYYYQPHLVSEITDSNGSTVKTISPTLVNQTISEETSAEIRSYMQKSVEEGTSIYSKVQGYSSGGKTGTAEKLPRGNGNYLVSFIGFAPVEDPQVVIYVVVDEPNTDDQASSTYAQYIAQAILSEVLPYMNVVPDESEDGTIPETELWEIFSDVASSLYSSDEDGNLTDTDGNLVDLDGNRIDENGYLLDSDGNYQYGEDGNWILSDALSDSTSSGDEEDETAELQEAISNDDLPEPLEDDTDPLEGNDMESEGITNEEAGLE
ncbi:MAG: cell division protein FtsI [Clostridiales bacterium]|nr:cell division protein FtsI [Clostridiales bacterium]